MAFVETRAVAAKLVEVAVPLRVPFSISGGTMTHRRSFVVVLETESGARGYGEAAPFEQPFYSPETTHSVRACLCDILIPRMLGCTLEHPAEVHRLVARDVRGNRMARAAVDTAWWDLQSRLQGVSLNALVVDRLAELGLPTASGPVAQLDCGAALGIPPGDNMDVLLAQVRDAHARGFRRIKIKIRPGWSHEPLREVLHYVSSSSRPVAVSVDANAAFHPNENGEELKTIDGAGAVFVEQPFAEESLWDLTEWNRQSQTPICLDETLVSDDVARQVIEMGGPDIWNLKVQRLGGLEETCRVYARGARSGARMWIGTMPETGLGAQAALAFGGLAAMAFPSDVGPSDWWFSEGTDLVQMEMGPDGRVSVPQKHGQTPRLDGAVEVECWG